MNYKDIHDRIIEKARYENRMKGNGNYYEAHHIVPRCMGGEGKVSQWKTHPNIVLLTGREHIIIHRLLCEIHPDNHKLIHAYWMLANVDKRGDRNYRVSAREYERLRIQLSELTKQLHTGKKRSEETKQKMKENQPDRSGENNSFYKKTHSEETRKKMKENQPDRSGEKNHFFGKDMSGENNPRFGVVISEDLRKKISESVKKGMTEEIRKKMKENHADVYGEKNPHAKKVICGVTGKIYGCIKDAAEDNGVNRGTLRDYLHGLYPNKTSLRFL